MGSTAFLETRTLEGGAKIQTIRVPKGEKLTINYIQDGKYQLKHGDKEQALTTADSKNIEIISPDGSLDITGQIKLENFDRFIINGSEKKDVIKLDIVVPPLSDSSRHQLDINTFAGNDEVELNLSANQGTASTDPRYNSYIVVDLGADADTFIGGCKILQHDPGMRRTYMKITADPDTTKLHDTIILYGSENLFSETPAYDHKTREQRDERNPRRTEQLEQIEAILEQLDPNDYTYKAWYKGKIKTLARLKELAKIDINFRAEQAREKLKREQTSATKADPAQQVKPNPNVDAILKPSTRTN